MVSDSERLPVIPAIPTTHENGTDHTGYEMPTLQTMRVQERADRGSWEGPLSPWHVLPDEVCLPGGTGFR